MPPLWTPAAKPLPYGAAPYPSPSPSPVPLTTDAAHKGLACDEQHIEAVGEAEAANDAAGLRGRGDQRGGGGGA